MYPKAIVNFNYNKKYRNIFELKTEKKNLNFVLTKKC